MSVLVVRVQSDDVEACSDWLFQLGATAIEERSTGDELNLVVGFHDDDAALAARSVLVERWPCRLEHTGDEAAWRDEWMKWIEPIEVAGLIVHAPWHDPSTWAADALAISIDPGRAFGSGHHPTTRLALTALDRSLKTGATVLDVGSGTGILSIAAAKLGAAHVVGTDLDHDILEVADANIEANGVASLITLRTDPIDDLDERFDVVVANIVIGELLPLMPALVAATDGVLIVCGFLDDQFEQVLSRVDATVIQRTTLDGWSCAILAPIP